MSNVLMFLWNISMIVATHHTYAQLLFEHRSKSIGCWCRAQCCVKLQSLWSHYTSRCNNFLGKLDFVTDRWFFFNLHCFQKFLNILKHTNTIFFIVCVIEGCMLAWHVRLAQLCSDLTLLGFGQVGCLRFHPFLVAIHWIWGSIKQYE